jgi:Protein of unknown function (DUF819)
LNFVATAELLQVPAAMCATALAVDNLLGLMYFPLVGWLGRNEAAETEPAVDINDTTNSAAAAATAASESSSAVTDEVERSSVAMTTGLAVAAVSEALARRYMAGGGPLIATGITVTLATLFPKRMQVCVCTFTNYHTIFRLYQSGSVRSAERSLCKIALLLPINWQCMSQFDVIFEVHCEMHCNVMCTSYLDYCTVSSYSITC